MCFVRLSHRRGVCPSVRPFVTPWHCIKTATPRITKSLLWAAPRTLVLATKFRVPGWWGSPRTRASKRGTLYKDVILLLLALTVWKWLQIGTDLLHIITSTSDRLFRFVNIDDRDFEPQKEVVWWFFLAVGHILIMNCSEMAGDRLKQPACEIFSIERRFLLFKFRPSRKSLRSRASKTATP